jgi:PAS domain S-box-containing protein
MWDIASARDLPAIQRRLVLGALIVVALALAAADYRIPDVQFRPLAFFLILVATAVGGLRFGMAFALLSAPLFTIVEWHNSHAAMDYRLLINAFIATVAFGFTPLLVILMQRRVVANERLIAQLKQAEVERQRLAEREATHAALARVEANYRAVGESIPFGIWQTDADGDLVYVSQSYREICGMSREELAKGGWLTRVPVEDAEAFLAKWAERDRGGDIWEGEYRLRGIDGKVYAILSRGVRLKDDSGRTIGWAGVSLDITQRKRAVDALLLLEEAGRRLVLSLDPPAILERIAEVCVASFADWCSFDIVDEEGDLQNVLTRHADRLPGGSQSDLHAYRIDRALRRGPAFVVKSGKPELCTHLPAEGLKSAMVVPLLSREKVLGTLTLVTAESGRRYDEDDLAVAQVLGVRTALAYKNALHYAREVRVADTLQRASLPTELPQLPGIRINATYMPGSSDSEIGGDWYDAYLLPNGEIGLTIGDVAGKGLRAAVAMGVVRQALRGAALDGLSPAAALKRVNRHLCHERTGMVTAVAATLNPTTNTIRFASAGHPPVIVISDNGELHTLKTAGIPLGLFAEAAYTEQEAQLKLGDLVILYTDGLTEYHRDVALGERLLEEAATAEACGDSPNPAVSIQNRIVPGQPKDDVAILTLTLSPAAIDRLDVEAAAVPSSARILRQSLRRLALGVGLSDGRTFALLVAAGEAISNAIEHAYGVSDGKVRVRGCREGERLIVEVIDSGGWRAPREEGRGRGLSLIRSIVDDAAVESNDSGTTVRLAMVLGEPKTA